MATVTQTSPQSWSITLTPDEAASVAAYDGMSGTTLAQRVEAQLTYDIPNWEQTALKSLNPNAEDLTPQEKAALLKIRQDASDRKKAKEPK